MLKRTFDLGLALRGVDAVVHLAARVHVMRDAAADPLAEFRRVNVQGTLNLARQAAAAGVKRFVIKGTLPFIYPLLHACANRVAFNIPNCRPQRI